MDLVIRVSMKPFVRDLAVVGVLLVTTWLCGALLFILFLAISQFIRLTPNFCLLAGYFIASAVSAYFLGLGRIGPLRRWMLSVLGHMLIIVVMSPMIIIGFFDERVSVGGLTACIVLGLTLSLFITRRRAVP